MSLLFNVLSLFDFKEEDLLVILDVVLKMDCVLVDIDGFFMDI